MGGMMGPHGALTAVLVSTIAFSDHSPTLPGPDVRRYNPGLADESWPEDETPGPETVELLDKPVA
eukprot:9503795-Heterocapsa_arctica.AAC.1